MNSTFAFASGYVAGASMAAKGRKSDISYRQAESMIRRRGLSSMLLGIETPAPNYSDLVSVFMNGYEDGLDGCTFRLLREWRQ